MSVFKVRFYGMRQGMEKTDVERENAEIPGVCESFFGFPIKVFLN